MLKSTIGIWVFLFVMLPLSRGLAQQTQVKGSVRKSADSKPLVHVKVRIENSAVSTETDALGAFILKGDLPLGEQVLNISLEGYKSKRYPIVINKGEVLDLGRLTMEVKWGQRNLGIAEISLTDQQLDNNRGSASNISGLLSSSKDVFFKAAAYDFSAAFFSPRGLGNENGRLLINGIEMNKMTNGRPEWSEIGGLNALQREEVFYSGLNTNPFQFGGIAGTTNHIMRASQYRKGWGVSYAASNRTYRGRVMASYTSGLMANGWAYAVMASRRFGSHGYKHGTPYNANAYAITVEKKINENHSLNFLAFYTPYRRAKASPITAEVKRLKGRHYNPYWGYLNGEVRNSRVEIIKQPVFMLNHYWDISPKVRLNTNVAYQFGHSGETRIDNGGTRIVYGSDNQKSYIGGARNPAPDYYQNLPSYFLRDENLTATDFHKAYLAEQAFIKDGQLNWAAMYEANAIAVRNGGHSTYILKEDRVKNSRLTANAILYARVSDEVELNASLRYRHLHSENFALVKDLLGGTGYLDIDHYANDPSQVSGVVTDLAQSDRLHPDRVVHEGERYKYNYDLNGSYASAFMQAQFHDDKIDIFVGAKVSHTSYQRIGQYKNGHFPKHSYGAGPRLNFMNYGIKGGVLYHYSGQHMLRLNAGYLSKAPTIRNAYPNARQSGIPVINLTSQKIQVANLSYIYRAPFIQARVTGFYSALKDGTDVGYFFTQGLSGMGEDNAAAFVQEVTTGINTRNLGIEFGVKAHITPTITLKAAGSFGQYVYTNTPNLYLTSADFKESLLHGSQLVFAQEHTGTPVTFGGGTTQLKNYHVANGPERVYQFGIEYQDPDYWFVGGSANFFSHSYIDISNLRRTANFALAADGLPLLEYDKSRARELLKQDKFGKYMLVNLIGGKSWKLGDYYCGFFAVVNNLLDEDFITGGYESSRKANYSNYNRDQSSPYGPQFGPSYFYGWGTTFYLSVYLRF